ncbi:MAG: hypothetical protein NVS9B12_10400 [Vulcanimicrobiaceae bacterium]
MDVQTLGPAVAPAPAVPDSGQSLGASAPSPSGAVQAAGLSPFPNHTQDSSQAPPADRALPQFTLPHEVAKIFTGSPSSNVQISFKVAHYPNEIVTVFRNSVTGEVISQVPSEIMLKIAEFFDQVAGVVVDKHA